VGFFDEIIDAAWLQPLQRRIRSPWDGPPSNELPVNISLAADLVQHRDLAIWLSGARLFTDGWELQLEIRWRPPRAIAPPFIPGRGGRAGLCLGLETSDGLRRLLREVSMYALDEPPTRPAFTAVRAHHGVGNATVDLWLWGLPIHEPTVVLEWRQERVREVRRVVAMTPPTGDANLNTPTVLWPVDAP